MVPYGHPQHAMTAPHTGRPKDPALAGVLSFLLVGAGQLYNGQPGKAIGMFVSCILLWAVLLGWVVNLWSIIDAVQTSRDMNRRLLPP